MNLHRISDRAEWQTIPPSGHNKWQKIANATVGTVTPGNSMTIVGLALSVVGLLALVDKSYLVAFGLIATGRLFDLADGWVADKTKTKSPLGEALDASVDKIITIATLITFALVQIVNLYILAILLLPHVVISIIFVLKRRRGVRFHPSKLGKCSMALVWVSLLAFIVSHLVTGTLAAVVEACSYGAGSVSVAMGILAAYGYQKD